MIDSNPEPYLLDLQNSLIEKTYNTSDYEVFNIVDKGKERTIYKLPYYPDRICQWAIMQQIENIFINTLIYDTYASLPKRGIHLGLKRVSRAMQNKEKTKYCLKLDIKKFFPSINHKILKNLLRKMNKISKKENLNFSDFCSINSYLGWTKWANAFNLAKTYLYPNLKKELIL